MCVCVCEDVGEGVGVVGVCRRLLNIESANVSRLTSVSPRGGKNIKKKHGSYRLVF